MFFFFFNVLLSLRLILFSPRKWKLLSTGKEFYLSLSSDLLKEESVGFKCLVSVRNVLSLHSAGAAGKKVFKQM